MDRQQAHDLLDQLGPAQFAAVTQLLEVLTAQRQPLWMSLRGAPIEDDEITEETAGAIDRSRASLARGEGIPQEQILREFGLNK